MNEVEIAPMVTDPVCGMAVSASIATAQGLRSEYNGETYVFCGMVCKLDFDETPEEYFDPEYVAST